MWMPKVYAFMRSIFATLKARYPWISRPFLGAVWTSLTINFGRHSSSRDHRDALNAAGVPCAIIALGNFDPTKGGHLVLFDIGYVIEFPSGSVAHIISGCLRHGNTPVAAHEYRASIVQHMSGGFSRFIDAGYTTVKSLFGTALEKALEDAAPTRRQEVLARFSTMDTLLEDRASLNL
jgi:hypothetical protein